MLRIFNIKQFDCYTLRGSILTSLFAKLKCNKLLFSLFFIFSTAVDANEIKVVMYGDSISAGYNMTIEESWPYLLNASFASDNSEIKLINESISGETTGGGLARIDNVLDRQDLSKTDWVIVELGGNDGLRGFPIKTIKNNLTALVDKIKSRGVNVAIMQIKIPPNYGKRYTAMFENVFQSISDNKKVTLMPFFMDTIAVNPNYMLQDGIHPNKSAQVIIRDIMKPEIIKLVDKPL